MKLPSFLRNERRENESKLGTTAPVPDGVLIVRRYLHTNLNVMLESQGWPSFRSKIAISLHALRRSQADARKALCLRMTRLGRAESRSKYFPSRSEVQLTHAMNLNDWYVAIYTVAFARMMRALLAMRVMSRATKQSRMWESDYRSEDSNEKKYTVYQLYQYDDS